MADRIVQLTDQEDNNIYPVPPFGLPLTVESGGTGADNAISALANLGIVDYVVERGTNYMKYASGLMIQWGKHTPGSTALSAMGNIYVSSWISATFPKPFVTFLGGALCKLDATSNVGIYNVRWETSRVEYSAWRADANYSGVFTASWVAFGTWK